MTQSEKYTYLDSLKGLSMLLIILMHCGISSISGPLGSIGSNFGVMGVSVFMLISGYLTFPSYESSSTDTLKWCLKKYMRLFPLYLTAIITALITGTNNLYWLGNESHVTVPNVLSHLLFIHGLFPHYCNSILGIEWYLGALFLYYLVTPILYKYIKSLESAIIALLLSLLATPVLNNLVYKIMPSSSDPIIYEAYKNTFSPIRLFPVFIVGIALYFIVKKNSCKSVLHNKSLSYILILFAFVMIVGQVLDANSLFHFSNYTMFSLWFGIIIFAQSLSENALLSNPVLRLIGKYSYAMYLFQYIVIEAYDKLTQVQMNFAVRFSLITVFLFLLSMILTKFIDTPFQKKFNSLLHLRLFKQ